MMITMRCGECAELGWQLEADDWQTAEPILNELVEIEHTLIVRQVRYYFLRTRVNNEMDEASHT